MCTCDCTELEDALDAMEDKIEEAEIKVSDYQRDLDSQKWYTQLIFDEIDFNCNLIGLDLTPDDSLDNFSSAKDIVDRCKTLSSFKLGIIFLISLAITLWGYISSYDTSKYLERYYLMKLNNWKKILEEREKKYDEIEDELADCYSDLTECEACSEEFVDKEECGGECDGCERWYCTNCFDGAIEEAELAAGEAF